MSDALLYDLLQKFYLYFCRYMTFGPVEKVNCTILSTRFGLDQIVKTKEMQIPYLFRLIIWSTNQFIPKLING
jgi:hypothetical protein